MQPTIPFFLITFILNITCQPAFSQTRQYKNGDRYRYRMTTDVTHNGKWQSTIIAECELQVKQDDAGVPYDEVHWISKKAITAKDTTDQSRQARQVTPYRISLHPKGTLEIPKIEDPQMTGEITDFNTFFVAISPKLGIGQLKKKGDRHVQNGPVKGDFSNGKSILVGNDCLAVTLALTESTKDHILFQTSFQPPADTCLHYLLDELKQPVAPDTINNFQMVQPSGANRFSVYYGRENFVINSTVQKKDGLFTQANMTNHLLLKIKLNCDERYSNCQFTMPFTIYRSLNLELLPNQ